jgi:hypothetical protein
MGRVPTLYFKCKVVSEFTTFVGKNYFDIFYDERFKSEIFGLEETEDTYDVYDSDDEYEPEENRRVYRNKLVKSVAKGWIEESELIEYEEQKRQKNEFVEKEYPNLPKSYKDIIAIWKNLKLGYEFRIYEFDGVVFEAKIGKLARDYNGILTHAYEIFLHDILVYITSEIIECEIDSDDYGGKTYYTDSELRKKYFILNDKIKSIEHTYSPDGSEIVETRVIYKHSIPKIQFLDLDRSYGFKQ